tara:strand:+ start:460 stop:1104 length:645 start_codon:yes stop_codon:yes gene_type:complete
MNQSFETTKTPITASVTQSPIVPITSTETNMFSGKNLVIVVLIGLLILSFLGINLLSSMDNIIQTISNVFGPLFTQVLSVFGYTAGTVIDKSTDVATNVAKAGIDLAGDTIQSAAELLKDASRKHVNTDSVQQLDKSINSSNILTGQPNDDDGSGPIQNPITSNKVNWCLVGEYQGKRGCIEVDDESKCMSGQTFPTQNMCLNPTRNISTHSHA